jgi:hypothetical protein
MMPRENCIVSISRYEDVACSANSYVSGTITCPYLASTSVTLVLEISTKFNLLCSGKSL